MLSPIGSTNNFSYGEPSKGNLRLHSGFGESMSNSKSDKPMRCSLDVRKIPIEAYKHPSTGRKWKAVARGMRALLRDLASYADPNGALGSMSPKMLTLEEHHHPSTLYDKM